MFHLVSRLLGSLNDTDRVAVIALAGVFASAVISAIVAIAVAGRSVYINSVTAERSKWIDKLRENISKLLGLHRHFIITQPDARYVESEAYKSLSREVGTLSVEIILQLNPQAAVDRTIIEIIQTVNLNFRNATFDYWLAERLLIEHSQYLFKEEWETVKYEASGPLRKVMAKFKLRLRQRSYESFIKGRGSLGPLEATATTRSALLVGSRPIS